MKTWPFAVPFCVFLGVSIALPAKAGGVNPNSPGVLEPVLSAVTGAPVRIPHTDQADGEQLLNIEGPVVHQKAEDTTSLLGYPINRVSSPNDDFADDLKSLSDAAEDGKTSDMRDAAEDLMHILKGTTHGRIYDGFALLNYNRGAYAPGQVPGEYKMKVLRDSGLTETGIDGRQHRIWDLDVSLFYYDGQIDSDTFLFRVPAEAQEFDPIRIHYRIYSTVREDFSPTVVMLDRRMPGSVQFPYKGLDAVWVPLDSGEVTELTVKLPPVRLVRGVYTWGWRVHPPRIQFLQPVFEHVNAHTGNVELEPQGESFAYRNRNDLALDAISDAAPEKKAYRVAKAVLDGADPGVIADWLNRPDRGPRGTWDDWADLAKNQRQLPPEAWDHLAAEGIDPRHFGPYRFVSVYMNNEMYGEGPDGARIEGWQQGDRFRVKLINLDNHTHYFRNVDFGPRLNDDISNCCGAGSHSFEIMNFKPSYGAPKVAEVQFRAGWGFRPHFNVIQQPDVFPRASDRDLLMPFFGGDSAEHIGYQYSAAARGGDFRFDPPPFVIGTPDNPAPDHLREADGSEGLLIGRRTEGYGVAQFCPGDPYPGFCSEDIARFNPNGALNWPPPPLQGKNGLPDHPTELRFPPFLRNPAQGDAHAGDIIPPTPAWKPFLWLNPANGSLFIDPDDPSKGYWADLTYAHGTPIHAGGSLNATVEAPRGSAQVFYQFDDLFHDNAIFSPHPTFMTE